MIGACYDNPENKHLLAEAHKGIYWLGLKNNVCDYLLQADFLYYLQYMKDFLFHY